MPIWIAQLVNGLSLGSLYVLLATGFNLLLLTARVLHYAYPVTVVFSMYCIWLTLMATGTTMLTGIVAGIVSAVALNLLCAPLFRRLIKTRRAVDINATMVLSLAIGMILTDLLSHQFNHGLPVAFPDAFVGLEPVVQRGLLTILRSQLLTLGASIAAVAALFFLLYTTGIGRALRAVAEDPVQAAIAGIPLVATRVAGYAISGILGGITAVLLAMLLGSASAGMGEFIANKVLAVSIVAGLGNLPGALVVGLALGILEAFVQGYVSGTWSNAIAFAVMLAVIVLKPRGLFGSKL